MALNFMGEMGGTFERRLLENHGEGFLIACVMGWRLHTTGSSILRAVWDSFKASDEEVQVWGTIPSEVKVSPMPLRNRGGRF